MFLAAMLLPAIQMTRTMFQKKNVQAKITALKMAVVAYKNKYGILPTASSPDNDQTKIESMMKWLTTNNQEKVNFLQSANLDTETVYRDHWNSSGKNVKETSANIFHVYIDDDYDNQITFNGKTYGAQVLIYSNGPNGDNENGEKDDITSWKK